MQYIFQKEQKLSLKIRRLKSVHVLWRCSPSMKVFYFPYHRYLKKKKKGKKKVRSSFGDFCRWIFPMKLKGRIFIFFIYIFSVIHNSCRKPHLFFHFLLWNSRVCNKIRNHGKKVCRPDRGSYVVFLQL